jgi:hypothetical protein
VSWSSTNAVLMSSAFFDVRNGRLTRLISGRNRTFADNTIAIVQPIAIALRLT